MIVTHLFTRRENGVAGKCRHCGAVYDEDAANTAWTYLRVAYSTPPPGHLRCSGIKPGEDRLVESPIRARGLDPANVVGALETLVPGAELAVDSAEMRDFVDGGRASFGTPLGDGSAPRTVHVFVHGVPHRVYAVAAKTPTLAAVVVLAAESSDAEDLEATAATLLLQNRVRRLR